MCTDYECPVIWREEWRTARRSHKCSECRLVIAKGERYEVSAGLSEGRWYGAKTCERCSIAREWLIVVCSGYLVGFCADDLVEHADEYGFWELRILASRMANGWVDKKTGKLVPLSKVRSLTKYATKRARDAGMAA
jgi:hypothetical protein